MQMSQKTTYICDRCKLAIKDRWELYRVEVEALSGGMEKDLCRECHRKLVDFFNSRLEELFNERA
jgi:hypothetical protein